MVEKKKTDSQRIKDVNEKFSIIIFFGIVILIINLFVLFVNALDNVENDMARELIIENYKLKHNITDLQMDKDILEVDIIECNMNNVETIVEEVRDNGLKEIECIVTQMEWMNGEYVESDWFVKAPTCYEVLQ